MNHALRRIASRSILVPVVALFVLTVAAPALGGHLAQAVRSYTGCLVNGTITQVAEGDRPAKRCSTGAAEVHFSGGDITAITGINGLEGATHNGAATLGIGASYRLPQTCAAGQVTKWDGAGWACAADDSATYTAGTGLSLDGTEFSVDPAYQIPQDCGLGDAATWMQTPVSLGEWGCQQFTYAGETCPTGQFARATDEHGGLVCAAPPTTGGDSLAIVFGRQVNPTQGNVPSESAGIPSDQVARTFASVSVPAGTYLVFAKGTIGSEHNADGFGETRCSIGADRVGYGGLQLDDDGFTGEFSLMEVVVSSGGTIGLECLSTFDGISLHQARITAIPFGG